MIDTRVAPLRARVLVVAGPPRPGVSLAAHPQPVGVVQTNPDRSARRPSPFCYFWTFTSDAVT
jgi:hypothetical protein